MTVQCFNIILLQSLSFSCILMKKRGLSTFFFPIFHLKFAHFAQKVSLSTASTRNKLWCKNQVQFYCTLYSLCQNVLLNQLLRSLVVSNVGTKMLKRKNKMLCGMKISRCFKDKGTSPLLTRSLLNNHLYLLDQSHFLNIKSYSCI